MYDIQIFATVSYFSRIFATRSWHETASLGITSLPLISGYFADVSWIIAIDIIVTS